MTDRGRGGRGAPAPTGNRDGRDPGAERPGDRPGEWRDVPFEAVRRLYGRARYDPDCPAPDRLVAALEGSERYRLTAARAVEAAAGRNPTSLARHRSGIAAAMDDADVARPLGRALGELAAADRDAVDDLLDRLRGNREVAAAEGLAAAADAAPAAVAGALDPLVDALGDDGAVRDPAVAALARLYAADPAGRGDVRLRIRDLIESADPGRRGGAARAVAMAAAEGCPAAEDALPAVASLLDRPFDGWRLVVRGVVEGALSSGSPRAAIRGDVLAGLEAVAESRPGALAGVAETILEGAYGDADERAETVLARAAVADRNVLEALVERTVPDGPSIDGIVGVDPSGAALATAAPERVDYLANRQDALRAILDGRPAVGHRLVEAVARERPRAVEWAADPLLARVDGPRSAIPAAASAFDALGALAATYPRIPRLLVERARTRSDERWAAAVAATRGVAAAAPDALLGTTAGDGTPVEALLAATLAAEPVDGDAAVALAHLGIRDPASVRRAAPRVRDAVRLGGADLDRPTYVLASVVARAQPGETRPLGSILLGRLGPGEGTGAVPTDPDRFDDGVVLLLGALCAEHDRQAAHVVEWLREAPGAVRPPLLRVLAEAAWPEGTAVAGHRPALAAATRTVDAHERAVATKALASTAGDGATPAAAVVDRLVELLYDPDPAVRRWAAFGVGECLAAGASHPDAVDRLSRVARVDDRRPAATLALVRAGDRPAGEVVEALDRAARLEYRAIGRTAVDELAGVDDPASTGTGGDPTGGENDATGDHGDPAGEGIARRLRSIRHEHPDPWVRARAADALDGIDGGDDDGHAPPE